MNELAKGLGLLEHLYEERILLRHALKEALHVEPIDISSLLPITGGRQEEFAVRIEKTSKTPHECCTDLILVKRDGAWQANLGRAAGMCSNTTI